MKTLKKIFKWLSILAGVILLLVLGFIGYVYSIPDPAAPVIKNESGREPDSVMVIDTHYKCIGENWITKNEWGLHEMYISGAAYERGRLAGKLSQDLIQAQEAAFTNQIKTMIPSRDYLKFLKYVIGFVNRDLSDHIKQEYKEEIYGISKSAKSGEFDWIGTNYSRILNYHSAHDVGHALQNMMLVGCTSFGAWGNATQDGSMILGRNFDFWVGDEFAANKIVAFVAPDSGYNFAYITWGGFTGVVSGMNDKGLTVTINAAPSKIPWGTATPVSLVAREILQYAQNTEEAIKIAQSRKMFVSETFMVGSAQDRKTILIEKTPKRLEVVYPSANQITSTNHFQGVELGALSRNMEAKVASASVYRQERLENLIKELAPLNTNKAAIILRDRYGLNDKDIGMGNEKAINQLIAHHSIIMMPDSLKFWVSSDPWQLGTYVCYDLNKVFRQKAKPEVGTVAVGGQNIKADSFLRTKAYKDFQYFRTVKNNLLYDYEHKFRFKTDSFMFSNPSYYDTYRILGDYYTLHNNYKKAEEMYTIGLKMEIATEGERRDIVTKLKKVRKRLH
jgi:isopenicillin-N N-acyltransferase-like protein